jgi:hypothetical protein
MWSSCLYVLILNLMFLRNMHHSTFSTKLLVDMWYVSKLIENGKTLWSDAYELHIYKSNSNSCVVRNRRMDIKIKSLLTVTLYFVKLKDCDACACRVYQVANVKAEWNLIKALPDLSGTGLSPLSCSLYLPYLIGAHQLSAISILP